MKELETGLWTKVSRHGTNYYSGKILVEGKPYWVRLFKNNKSNDKQPDLKLMLELAEEKPNIETPSGFSYSDDDIPF